MKLDSREKLHTLDKELSGEIKTARLIHQQIGQSPLIATLAGLLLRRISNFLSIPIPFSVHWSAQLRVVGTSLRMVRGDIFA